MIKLSGKEKVLLTVLIIIAFLIIFIGVWGVININDYRNNGNDKKPVLPEANAYLLKKFEGMTPLQIKRWILDNIEYEDEGIFKDVWKHPIRTLKDGRGDCEDRSLLFLYLCYHNGYGKGILIIYDVPDNLFVNHAVANVDDVWMDIYASGWRVIKKYSYDQAMRKINIK